MTYKEAAEKTLGIRWKTSTCPSGEICWCRVIEPETPVLDEDGSEIYIVAAGCIPTAYAEHIVELHNKSLLK